MRATFLKSKGIYNGNFTAVNIAKPCCRGLKYLSLKNLAGVNQPIIFANLGLTANELNQPIYSYHETQAGRHRVKNTMETNLLNWCNLVSISKKIVFTPFWW